MRHASFHIPIISGYITGAGCINRAYAKVDGDKRGVCHAEKPAAHSDILGLRRHAKSKLKNQKRLNFPNERIIKTNRTFDELINKYDKMIFFGGYLRNTRERQGLPLRKVAAQLGIGTSILSKIERSERVETKEMLSTLAKTLEIQDKEIK